MAGTSSGVHTNALPNDVATPAGTPKRYEPHNILFTGGCGFIGSHVLNHLVTTYPHYNVVNLDIVDSCASLQNVAPSVGKPNYHYCRGDICNLDLVAHLMEAHRIDTVMHFAAQSHVDVSFGNPLAHTQTNVLGTHTLLECARRYGVKRFLHVSTDEVYGDVQGDGVFENATLAPTNPYSCSKAAGEFIAKAYMSSYKLPARPRSRNPPNPAGGIRKTSMVIITRGNNVYGPAQYPEKVIPKFILRLLRGETACLHGAGSSRRSYVHVRDCVTAFDKIMHYGANEQVYNIGSPFEISMKELAVKLIQELGLRPEGREHELLEFVADRNINDQRYCIDDSKLKELGWAPSVEWEDGIRDTIAWYRAVPPDHWPEFVSALAPHPLPSGARPAQSGDGWNGLCK